MKYQHHKESQLPVKYSPEFLARLDTRYKLAKELRRMQSAIADDLGGERQLSTVQRVLIEKFVWATMVTRAIEREIATAKPPMVALWFQRWAQGMGILTQIGAKLGLKRQAKPVESLEAYVKRKDKRHGHDQSECAKG